MSTIVEKELKILEIDPIELQKKLCALGASRLFSGKIHDIYYDCPQNSLQKSQKRIRIRKKGDSHLITLKDLLPSKKLKKATETELYVEDHKQIDHMLQTYGLFPIREKKKERISYSLDGVIFDIDFYEGIPPVLEIEAWDHRTIKKWIRKLDLQKKTIATFGANGLFKYYKQVTPNQTKLVSLSS